MLYSERTRQDSLQELANDQRGRPKAGEMKIKNWTESMTSYMMLIINPPMSRKKYHIVVVLIRWERYGMLKDVPEKQTAADWRFLAIINNLQ